MDTVIEDETSVVQTEDPVEENDVEHDEGEGSSQGERLSKQSKQALKRERRRELFQSIKQAKKLKKKEERAQKIANGEVKPKAASDPSLVPSPEEVAAQRQARKQAQVDAYLAACRENFEVIIDCGWEDEHNDSTLASLTQQIMFCYGLNKRSEKPSLLHLSGLGPRTQSNLSKVIFHNWVGVTSSSADYIEETERYSVAPCEGKKQLVYLTSDAEEVLETLDPSHAYIIGGIVDRNRLKGATYHKALRQGVRTAKLPIKEYFSLSATHVLTVNHVFEILSKYNTLKSWPETLAAILPKRKEATIKDAKQEQEDEENEQEGEVERKEEDGQQESPNGDSNDQNN